MPATGAFAYRGDSFDRRPTRYTVSVRDLADHGVSADDATRVSERFAFRANDYYLGLIDWSDPHDPIRRLIVPDPAELDEFGSLDASDEAANTMARGLQHKYADTALMLVTDQCGGFCRYCFRKRLFLPGSRGSNRHTAAALAYIEEHPEISDVLLTGGDPLTLSTARLRGTLRALAEIEHVRTIRIGSKMLAFNPYRVLDDPLLQAELLRTVTSGTSVYVMAHFDHPRELTEEAVAAVATLRRLGVIVLNQCPITAGINDDADVLAELFHRCTEAGCPQYYVFQCRPTIGNRSFEVPLVRSFELVNAARTQVSGLSRRARLCLSHATGKVEVVGVDDEHIYARYHRAKDPADEGRMLVLERDDGAYWLDQLMPA